MDDSKKIVADGLAGEIKAIDPAYKVQENSNIPLEIYSGESIMTTDYPEPKYIIDPWLSEQGIVMIHAKAGTGKTYFTLSAAIAISLGKDFINWKVRQPKKVLYVDGEMQGYKMKARLMQLLTMFPGYNRQFFKDNFYMITPDKMKNALPSLATDAGQDYINRYVKQMQIDVVVIDNVSCLMGEIKENDADAWQVIQTWELQLRKMGTSVIRVQHSGKNKTHRGSSKHQDIVDTTIFLEQPEDGEKCTGARFLIHFEKHRGFCGTDTDSFEIKLINDVHLGICWQSQTFQETIEKRVVSLFLEHLSYKEIQIECGIPQPKVTRIIQDARTKGLISASELLEYKKTYPKNRLK